MYHYRYCICVMSLITMTTLGAADDKPPAKPVRMTYRVVGLFAPDREKDLRDSMSEISDVKVISINFDDAEMTIEYLPGKSLQGAKQEQIINHLEQQLSGITHGGFSVKPQRTQTREKLEQIVIPATAIDCKGCAYAAYDSIAGIDGVVQATVSFKEGRVTALIDPNKTGRTKLEDALKKRGVKLGK